MSGRRPVPAGALHAALASLDVEVESIAVVPRGVLVASYPGGVRPSAVLSLGGRGEIGQGEHVVFDDAEHAQLGERVGRMLRARRGAVGTLIAALEESCAHPDRATAWARAAVEAALVELALRQAGLTLAELAGAPPFVSTRCVTSFEACADPAARVRSLRERFPTRRFKVDVDPGWTVAAADSLAATGAVDVLDFKGRAPVGDGARAERLAERFPGAILEDPPEGSSSLPPARVARDIPILDADAARRAVEAGEGVNVKPARMGGPLEALRALDAGRAGAPLYVGGMFEVGVGRAQARALAALFCAEGPNDLAPVAAGEPVGYDGARLRVRLDGAVLGRDG